MSTFAMFSAARAAALAAAALSLGTAAMGAQPVSRPGAAPQAKSAPVAPAKPGDDPAKVAAARQFITAYHPQTDPQIVSKMIDQVMPRMIEAAKRGNSKLDPKKFAVETKAKYMQTTGRMLDLQSLMVSRHFSLQELNALTAFFRGPLGHKLMVETPKIRGDMLEEKRRQEAASPSKKPGFVAEDVTEEPKKPAPKKK